MKEYITELNGNVAVDDTILTVETPTTAGSRTLENFTSLFEATAVTKMKAAGYTLAGKTAVGEFGLDVLGETCYFDAPLAAAASLVKNGAVKYALNVDLNGAPRRAAAIMGVTFIKPTYGTVSRMGIIPCACSGEQIGVTAKTAADAAELLSAIAGHDDGDGTSLPAEKYDYDLTIPMAGKRVGIIKELMTGENTDKVQALAEKLKSLGAEVKEVSLPEVTLAKTAWQVLLAAETCNNLSRYDGVKFGYRTNNYKNIGELYTNSRTEGLGLLSKAVILYGSDVLSKGRYDDCYDRALRARRAVREALTALFAEVDMLLSPACFKASYEKEELKPLLSVYNESLFTAFSSITGTPAIITGGVQIAGDTLSDALLLSAAAETEVL